jgi:hypothetical protein
LRLRQIVFRANAALRKLVRLRAAYHGTITGKMCLWSDACSLLATQICPPQMQLIENAKVPFGSQPALLLTVLEGASMVVVILALEIVALVSITIASTISGMNGRRGS